MGGAAAAQLEAVRQRVRTLLGAHGERLPNTCDDITDEVLRAWPTPHMSSVALKGNTKAASRDVLAALRVISAKVREMLEARHGCDANTMEALALLCEAVTVEIANLWFAGTAASRKLLRESIKEVRNRDVKKS